MPFVAIPAKQTVTLTLKLPRQYSFSFQLTDLNPYAYDNKFIRINKNGKLLDMFELDHNKTVNFQDHVEQKTTYDIIVERKKEHYASVIIQPQLLDYEMIKTLLPYIIVKTITEMN